MGDIIEFTTSPNHSNIFYKLTSSGIIFEVKGALNAAVGLARSPGSYCDVWVLIGMNNQICIKKEQGGGKICRTQSAIIPTAYKRYWLSWRNGCIQLGQGSERNPLISYPNDILLSYITFSASGLTFQRANLVHWRVELPPILEKPKIKSVTGGELQWLHVDNQLPDGALIGGFENETLYIIRAPHQGSLTPGKFVPSQGTAYISWGGNEHEKENFDVLCGFDCTWVPTSEDRIPVGAVEAGYSEDARRDKLYVGRATHCGHLIPGKVQPSHKVCYIPYGGREIAMKKYEILVCEDTNSRCANRMFIQHISVASPPDSDEDDHHYFGNDDDDDILIDHAF